MLEKKGNLRNVKVNQKNINTKQRKLYWGQLQKVRFKISKEQGQDPEMGFTAHSKRTLKLLTTQISYLYSQDKKKLLWPRRAYPTCHPLLKKVDIIKSEESKSIMKTAQ